MKNLGPLLAGGLTLLVVMLVGIFSFLPAGAATQPAAASAGPIVIPAVDTTNIQASIAERDAAYQAQINQLNQTLQERQATYQTQADTLKAQTTAAQAQLTDLKNQEQNLPAQISQFDQARADRLAVYQAQLDQLNQQYQERLAQLQTQLNDVQAKLAEANAQLGR